MIFYKVISLILSTLITVSCSENDVAVNDVILVKNLTTTVTTTTTTEATTSENDDYYVDNYNEPFDVMKIEKPIMWSTYNILAVTTASLMVIVGISTIISILFPLFTFKICYFFGGCRNQLANYIDQLLTAHSLPRNDDVYATYPRNNYDYMAAAAETTTTSRNYDVDNDYLSPIVKVLMDAYTKYEPKTSERFKRSLNEIDDQDEWKNVKRTLGKLTKTADDNKVTSYTFVNELCKMYHEYFNNNNDDKERIKRRRRSLSEILRNFISDNGNKRNRRSLEYIGPLLETAVSIYEHFGNEDVKKNSEIIR